MNKIKYFYKKHPLAFWLTMVGLLAGFLYYYYVGCASGACPLKKLWYYDMALGGLLGWVIGDSIDTWITKKRNKNEKSG
ncbi:MAG: hypothetical protein ACQES0_01695 [Bacteroidota bacterium]